MDDNRRRLTPEERDALLARPLAAVFSTVSPGGWIHSVPVHFLPSHDGLRILAGAVAVKTRNATHTGHATLCVEVTDGPVRSFVTASGPVEILQPPPPADLAALDQRYSRTDFSSLAGSPDAVMLVLRPDRWIAWMDWD
jgi:hypothetical protein